MEDNFKQRGFLPTSDPQASFPEGSEFAVLDEIGRDLPSLLEDSGFRQYAREFVIPPWPQGRTGVEHLPGLRLYYVRLGFLASAYVNQLGQEPARSLPQNIARPLCSACELLKRPPFSAMTVMRSIIGDAFGKMAP